MRNLETGEKDDPDREIPGLPRVDRIAILVAMLAGTRSRGLLALMADDVVIEDPIGKSITNPEGTGVRGKQAVGAFFDSNIAPIKLTITCEESFPSSSPDEIAHILLLHFRFDGGFTSQVRGVFTYKVNDAGLITNMRGYWNLEMMEFGKEE